jgi:serine/threonine protein kinase
MIVFSFGSMLYEMLTRQRAFRGETKASTIAAILKEEPKSISEVAEGLPREVERIVKGCLRKDPEHRFQTMADLKVAVDELKEESESGKFVASEVTKRRRAWFPFGARRRASLCLRQPAPCRICRRPVRAGRPQDLRPDANVPDQFCEARGSQRERSSEVVQVGSHGQELFRVHRHWPGRAGRFAPQSIGNIGRGFRNPFLIEPPLGFR